MVSPLGEVSHLRNNNSEIDNDGLKFDELSPTKTYIRQLNFTDLDLSVTCPYCDSKVLDLKEHFLDKKVFKLMCNKCKFQTANYDCLQGHKSSAHGKRKILKCKKCGISFKSMILLKLHKSLRHKNYFKRLLIPRPCYQT